MRYEAPLLPLSFTAREKRFFVHGELSGTIATAHCPNTGSLKSILDVPVRRVWLHDHGEGGNRKLRYTTEVVELPDGTLINIHTGKANTLVGEALHAGTITELTGAQTIKAEAKWDAATRFDFHLTDATGTPTWVEVKSVTLKAHDGQAAFPDAVSERGRKHLGVLAEAVAKGHRAVQLYLVGRTDCQTFRPADEIDPAYAAELRRVAKLGVEILCYGIRFEKAPNGVPTAVFVDKSLPISL
jgi:sugar fermentation stimulation protein A